jgi:uncharacterized protein YdaU (DUF1376 family)
MKWYKHDPNAALAGMFGLSVEERGAYYTLIDLLYARDGGGVTDELVCGALACHGRTWNALKKRLIGKGKIWVQADGTLMAKRVENALKESRNFSEKQAKLARKRWHSEENQELTKCHAGNASTPTPTIETSSFLTAARESKKRKRKIKNRTARSLASALPSGALTREPKVSASPSLEEIVRAKGWAK